MAAKPAPTRFVPSIPKLLKALDFTPETIAQAATEQPGLFMVAAEYRVDKLRARATAAVAHERIRAEQSLKLRAEARESGEKLTEAGIQDHLAVNRYAQEAAGSLAAAEESEEFAKLLLEAYRMRRDCLRVVAELVGVEVAMQKAVEAGAQQLAKLRPKLQEKWPGGG